ncbi:MAG: DnaA regulatory inactivator Hda [Legionellales bacterium]|nr:DnaA regulatory inactivator Hda [Legionellales bacterium]
MATKDFSQIKQQLALAMQCNDEASFADFCWTGNELLQQQILSSLPEKKEHLFYVWGLPGAGKSHLLQAACQAMAQAGHAVAYLPLKLLRNWDPAILEGMADHSLVAVDDIEQIAGHSAWEEALFHLYNRLHVQHNTLIITGQVPPVSTTLHLADLRSRLTYALVLQIHELKDEDKINTLQEHAKKRGLELSKSVGHYILNRCARNMHDLQTVLDRLDHASLVAQRKLTIPFVKDVLGV